jgi:hypothetical protein
MYKNEAQASFLVTMIFFCLVMLLLCSFHVCWFFSFWSCFLLWLLDPNFLFCMLFFHVVPLTMLFSCCFSHCYFLCCSFCTTLHITTPHVIPFTLSFLTCYHSSHCSSSCCSSFIIVPLALQLFSCCSSHPIAPLTMSFPSCCFFRTITILVFQVCTSPTFIALLALPLLFLSCYYSSHVATLFCIVNMVLPLPLSCASRSFHTNSSTKGMFFCIFSNFLNYVFGCYFVFCCFRSIFAFVTLLFFLLLFFCCCYICIFVTLVFLFILCYFFSLCSNFFIRMLCCFFNKIS